MKRIFLLLLILILCISVSACGLFKRERKEKTPKENVPEQTQNIPEESQSINLPAEEPEETQPVEEQPTDETPEDPAPVEEDKEDKTETTTPTVIVDQPQEGVGNEDGSGLEIATDNSEQHWGEIISGTPTGN